MTKLSPQAVNLLKRVRQQITEHPETYDHNYVTPVCGTACCIAGNICILTNSFPERESIVAHTEHAMKILGIEEKTHAMFGLNLFGYEEPKKGGFAKNTPAWGAQKITEFIEAHT